MQSYRQAADFDHHAGACASRRSRLALGPPQKQRAPGGGQPQVEISRAIGRLQQAGDQAVRARRGKFDFLLVALDRNHAPQQFARGNGRIVVTQTVAARDQERFCGAVRGGAILRSTTRWTNKRPLCRNSTTSPGEISPSSPAGSQPNRREEWQAPCSCRRRADELLRMSRTTSSASPQASSIEAFP